MVTFSIRGAAASVSSPASARWRARLVTLAVWALLAASTTYWVLQWPQDDAARRVPTTTQVGGGSLTVAPTSAAIGPALGAAPSASDRATVPALSSRLSLVGVVRAGAHDGAALIAVDGKPARPVQVGGEVEPGLYLLALEPRRASLGPERSGAETVALELPKPKVP
jgi:general secretion pathway protein C